MSSDLTPQFDGTTSFEPGPGVQPSSPITGDPAANTGRTRFYVGILLLLLVGSAAYWVDVQYRKYLEAESIQALKASGLVVSDLGESLSISDPSRKCVTNECLFHLCDLNRPVKVSFNDCSQITDAGLRHLTGNKRIRMLHLSSTGVTDAGMVHLSGMASLESLDLSNTRVSDAGLADLSLTKLDRLQDLNLGVTQISDSGLQHLSELDALRFLVVEGTKVTGQGAQQLRTANPEVYVFGSK